MDQFMNKTPAEIDRKNKIQNDKKINDCDNVQRYDKIFDKMTKNQFMIMMAILHDSFRRNRIQDEEFCSIVSELLNNARSVLAIKEQCGGTTTASCNGCADGEGPSGLYAMNEFDVSETELIEPVQERS